MGSVSMLKFGHLIYMFLMLQRLEQKSHLDRLRFK